MQKGGIMDQVTKSEVQLFFITIITLILCLRERARKLFKVPLCMLSAVLQYNFMSRRRCFWISVSDGALDCDLLAWTHLQHTRFAPALAFIFARKCDGCTPELEMNLPTVLCPSSAVSCCNKFFSLLSITYQSPSAMILRILSFGGGGALGYFLGGYVPPGTPNWHPGLKKFPPKIDNPF